MYSYWILSHEIHFLNNYQWHTHSCISMFTDFKHSHVCTLFDSNSCFNFRWNDIALLNQKITAHFRLFFGPGHWTHTEPYTKQMLHHWARSLPYFPFLYLAIFKFKFKKIEEFYTRILHLHNFHFVLSSLKFLLCLPNFLSSSWMSSSLLLLCYSV